MRHWQVQEAKAKFSEVIKQARECGPQEITSHGRPVAVVLSREAYDRLTGNDLSLVEFMRRSPLYGMDTLEFERDAGLTREEALFELSD